MRHQVSTSSTSLSGVSLLHSNGVSSIKAGQVVPSSEMDLLPPRGWASSLAGATRKSLLWWVTLTFLPSSHLVCRYLICDLMYYHILSFPPPIFHFHFSLEHIQFHEYHISWHELHGTGHSIVIPFLPVCFTVGLQVCFDVSFLEVSPHFFNVHRDMAGEHMSAPCWEVKIHWEMRVSPKHQVMQ